MAGRKEEYLKLARSLEDYGSVRFPHCECDAHKSGHIIVSFGLQNVKLQACTVEGELESQTTTFRYDELLNWDEDEEAMAFYFEYSRSGKKPRSVRIMSPYYKYMYECAARVCEEIEWNEKENISSTPTEKDEKELESSSSADHDPDGPVPITTSKPSKKLPKPRKPRKIMSVEVSHIDNDDL